jgi:hypothetical protein
MVLLLIFVQSLFAYATAWIVLMGHRLWPAIRDSVRVAIQTFVPTLVVVGVPVLLVFPFSYATTRVDLIMGKFRPEIAAGLVCMQLVCQVIATFLLVGAVTRLFMWRVEAAR